MRLLLYVFSFFLALTSPTFAQMSSHNDYPLRKLEMNDQSLKGGAGMPDDTLQSPQFIDFKKEIQSYKYKSTRLYCVKNTNDSGFFLSFRFPVGELHNLRLPLLSACFFALESEDMPREKWQSTLSELSCAVDYSSIDDYSVLTLSGANSKDMESVLRCFAQLLANVHANDSLVRNVMANYEKQRMDAKSVPNAIFGALSRYAMYGESLTRYTLSNEQLKNQNADSLCDLLRYLLSYRPEILYYGPMAKGNLTKMLNKYYKMPRKMNKSSEENTFDLIPVTENRVFFLPYNLKKARVMIYHRSEMNNVELYPIANVYNCYFGSGDSSVTHKELKDKHFFAQSAFVLPTDKDAYMYNYDFFATSADNLLNALAAMEELNKELPLSQTDFDRAKEVVKNKLANSRIPQNVFLDVYFLNLKRGFESDYRKLMYEAIDALTLDDMVAFYTKFIQDKPQFRVIMADETEIDGDELQKLYGPITKLTIDQIFGY